MSFTQWPYWNIIFTHHEWNGHDFKLIYTRLILQNKAIITRRENDSLIKLILFLFYSFIICSHFNCLQEINSRFIAAELTDVQEWGSWGKSSTGHATLSISTTKSVILTKSGEVAVEGNLINNFKNKRSIITEVCNSCLSMTRNVVIRVINNRKDAQISQECHTFNRLIIIKSI